jgi:hypothetical protein
MSDEPKVSDPRVDRAITWTLQALMTAALAVGGWYARVTGEKVEALTQQLGEIRTEVAVQRTMAAQIERLDARVLRLEDRLTSLQERSPR